MELNATGLGTGLDITGIVEQLVAAERQPVADRLNLREARTNAELSALGQFKSALSSFQDSLETLSDLSSFQKRAAAVSDEELIGVTVDSSASPSSYEIEVLSLATSQKLASGAFTGADAVVGTGTLAITVAGQSSLIVLADGANTLADLRDLINAAPDNPGVRATIVNAADGAHLIVSSAETGVAQAITIDALDASPNSLEAFEFGAGTTNSMSELEAPADASVLIDGFPISSSANVLTDAIEGTTIDLLAAAPGSPATLTVSLDEAAAKESVGAFVSAYNALVTTIAEVTAFNAETGEAGPLLGDSAVRGIKNQIRRELGNAVDVIGADFRTLAEIGITTQPDGQLELDDTKLSAAITDNFDGVGALFASDDGAAVRLSSIVEGVLSSDGSIENRESTLKEQLDRIGDQRETLDQRIERVRERLLDQFNAMDRLVAQLQNTSSFLSQQLAGF